MAFFKKAAKGKSPGTVNWTKENMKHVGWCMRKGIYVSVQPRGADWEIEIRMGKNIHVDPKAYEGKEAQVQMYKYYKYYYDKH
tara:strand:+ start:241 stop:489 length:249 start_codon:yes stop_codon:yes gene_type:complete